MGFRLRESSPVVSLEELELRLTPDEHGLPPPDSPRPHQVDRADKSAATDAAGLALRLDRRRLLELERATDSGHRSLTGEDLPRLGRLLQARRHVHGVAGQERAAGPRRADDHLAGV